MIIDVSNIIGKHKFKVEITAESLLKEMNVNSIDIAVINSYAESVDNESIHDAFTKYPHRFIGLFTVNPWDNDAVEKFEDALKNKGFKGIYMNPLRHGYMLCEHQVFYPLLDVCRKYDVPAWIYGAAEVFTSPIFFDAIAADYPDVNIIMGRMGLQYDNASAVAIAKKHKNIFLETSSSMDFNTHRAMKTAGIDQVLLGTGTPEAGYYEFELLKVRNAAKNFENGEEKVLWENAARIFHLTKEERL
ncbi:MAG: amidohydrolase family protein [Clostridiaceae bacterium]